MAAHCSNGISVALFKFLNVVMLRMFVFGEKAVCLILVECGNNEYS